MNALYIIAITILVTLLTLFEWSKLSRSKEKLIFSVLMGLGYSMAVLIILVPDLPGPTQLVESIFKPLGKLLKNN